MISHILLLTALSANQPMNEVSTAPCVVTLPALHALQDESLGSMRAGSPLLERPFADTERETLRALAQRDGRELSELRAGAMSDHDWKIVGLIAVAVLVLVVIF